MNRTARVGAAAAVAAVTGLWMAGCTGAAPPTTPESDQTARPVVDHQGYGAIRFGDTRADLERDHGLTQRPGDCAPRLPGHPEISPVLDPDDRLVLVWVNPPLQTPVGIGVGTPVDAVRRAHPDAEELAAPPGTQRFDGLLVTVADRAYLYLHDGTEVRKVIVGYADYARLLFDEGFGTC